MGRVFWPTWSGLLARPPGLSSASFLRPITRQFVNPLFPENSVVLLLRPGEGDSHSSVRSGPQVTSPSKFTVSTMVREKFLNLPLALTIERAYMHTCRCVFADATGYFHSSSKKRR